MKSLDRKNKVGTISNYLVLTELPSKQRSYNSINSILIRGLLFDEVKSLSKYVDLSSSLRQLINAYRDVIILQTDEGKEVPLEELELVDFHYLMVTSTIMSTDNASVDYSYICKHCDNENNATLVLDNLKYNVPFTELVGGVVPTSNDNNVHPVKLKDLIKLEDIDLLKERYKSKFKLDYDIDVFQELLSYAVCLDWNTEDDILDNLNLLNSNRKLLREVVDISDQLYTELTPVTTVCPKCGKEVKLKFDFDSVRGYL